MTEPVRAAAPKGQYWATIGGRDILVKHANEAQAMVLGGIHRQAQAGVDVDQGMALFGKLMRLFDALIADPADRDWLEGEIIDGRVVLEDFGSLFFSLEEGAKKPVKPRRAK